jgi:hypothetical protein
MACCALKKDLTDCRNWSSLDGKYCHVHQHITDQEIKDRWMKRFFLGGGGRWVFIYDSATNSAPRILEDLYSGRIVLTDADAQKLPSADRFIDTYVFLVRHGFISATANNKLLLRSLLYLLNTTIIHQQIGRPVVKPLLLSAIPEALILKTSQTLYHFLSLVPLLATGSQEKMSFLLTYVPTLLETEAAKELSWWSREKLDTLRVQYQKLLGEEHPLTKCLLLRWLLDLKELYKTEKAIQKIQMDQCKEELMMNRWHPDRVWRYYEEFGIDIEDM